MAVEIKELVIRAVVRTNEAQGERDAPAEGKSEADHDAIVIAAVREVLRIVKASKER